MLTSVATTFYLLAYWAKMLTLMSILLSPLGNILPIFIPNILCSVLVEMLFKSCLIWGWITTDQCNRFPMNGALVGAGWHKPEVLSLHPVMCFFLLHLFRGRAKNRRCALHCMATFFFFFFKIWHYCDFYLKLSQSQWSFWNFFAKHWGKNIS